MQDSFSTHHLLDIAREFDGSGGISVGLVAWELTVDEALVATAIATAHERGWIEPAGHDQMHDEPMWRLTLRGRAAAGDGLS